MPWARLDDNFYAHPKIRRVWVREPKALALHVMAISYAGKQYEGEGFIDPEWVMDQVSETKERRHLTNELVVAKLWHEHGDGWIIHDYLDYNRSAEEVERDKDQRRRAGKRGGKRAAERRANGQPSEPLDESPNGQETGGFAVSPAAQVPRVPGPGSRSPEPSSRVPIGEPGEGESEGEIKAFQPPQLRRMP